MIFKNRTPYDFTILYDCRQNEGCYDCKKLFNCVHKAIKLVQFIWLIYSTLFFNPQETNGQSFPHKIWLWRNSPSQRLSPTLLAPPSNAQTLSQVDSPIYYNIYHAVNVITSIKLETAWWWKYCDIAIDLTLDWRNAYPLKSI